jgi:hypothetical protein
LKLDLTHRTFSESGLGSRPLALTIQPVLAGGRKRSRGWQLHGTVKSRVTLDTRAIHFGERPIHSQPPVTQKVLATVHVPCRRLEVTVKSEVAAATVNRRSDDEGRFEIIIAVNPALPPGYFHTDAQISLVTPAGERCPGFTLPIAGKMQPEVRLLPARVIMGPKQVGGTAEAVVTLQTTPNSNVEVDHIETDSSGLRVEPAAIEGIPANHAFRVRQQVTREGEQTSTAR